LSSLSEQGYDMSNYDISLSPVLGSQSCRHRKPRLLHGIPRVYGRTCVCLCGLWCVLCGCGVVWGVVGVCVCVCVCVSVCVFVCSCFNFCWQPHGIFSAIPIKGTNKSRLHKDCSAIQRSTLPRHLLTHTDTHTHTHR